AGAPHQPIAGGARGSHSQARSRGDTSARRLPAGYLGRPHWRRDPQPRPGGARERKATKETRPLTQARVGRLAPHQAFLRSEQLLHRECLEEARARVRVAIDQRLAAERAALALLDTIPG